MPADLLRAARVLRAIEQEDFPVFHDGRRIERGVGFPQGGGIRRDHGVDLGRLGKRSEHPRLQQSKARSHKLGTPARRPDRYPATATASSNIQETMGTAT